MEFIGKDDLISSIVNKPSKINRAHWIVSYQSKTKKIQICSHCGKSVVFDLDSKNEFHYCPLCGAKMDEKL